jgi:hypothetical protein
MCAFEGKATTHSQFLASDKFRAALRERTYLGHRQIIEICDYVGRGRDDLHDTETVVLKRFPFASRGERD